MFWEVLWDIFPTHKKIEDPLMWLLLWTLGVETHNDKSRRWGWKWRRYFIPLNAQEVTTDFQVTKEYKTGAVHVMIK
jgi:hypothetical protein